MLLPQLGQKRRISSSVLSNSSQGSFQDELPIISPVTNPRHKKATTCHSPSSSSVEDDIRQQLCDKGKNLELISSYGITESTEEESSRSVNQHRPVRKRLRKLTIDSKLSEEEDSSNSAEHRQLLYRDNRMRSETLTGEA